MKIKRMEHVAIVVEDMNSGMRMLEDVLGLKLDYAEETPTAKLALYPVGDSNLELVEAKSGSTRSGAWLAKNGQSLYHLCFEVEDIEASLAELRAKGVGLIDETPRQGHGGSRIAFLDPSSTGNILVELVEI